MRRNGKIVKSAGLLVLLLAWAAFVSPAWAHTGGVLYLANEPAGPYEISTWALPQLLTTAEPVHLDILVLKPVPDGQTTQDFVLGADILVRASSLDGELVIVETSATNIDAQNELFYEAFLELEQPGAWQIEIIVDSTDGVGQASFEVVVERDSNINWYLIGGAAVVVVAAAIFVMRSRPEGKGA